MFSLQLLLFVLLRQALSGHYGSPGLLSELLSGWLHHGVGRLLLFWAHRMELCLGSGGVGRTRRDRFSPPRYGQPHHLGSVAALRRGDLAAMAEAQRATIRPVDGIHFGQAAAGVFLGDLLRCNLGGLIEVTGFGDQPGTTSWCDTRHGLREQQQGAC